MFQALVTPDLLGATQGMSRLSVPQLPEQGHRIPNNLFCQLPTGQPLGSKHCQIKSVSCAS